MFFTQNLRKLLFYYYNQKRHYQFYFKTGKYSDWKQIDTINDKYILFQNELIPIRKIKQLIITYQSGEILDYYGKFLTLPTDVYEIKNSGLKNDRILSMNDIDFSNNRLSISHEINNNHPRKNRYITLIRNLSTSAIKIYQFGGYLSNGDKLLLNNIIYSLYSHKQFKEWFFVKNNGWILSNEQVSDPNNYGYPGFWIYFCENELGEKFIVGKEIEFE